MGYVSGLESTSLQGTELGLERWPLGSARKLPCFSPVSPDLPWDQAWDTMALWSLGRVAEVGAGSGQRRASSGAPCLSLFPTPQGEEPPLSALPLLREGPAGRVPDVPGTRTGAPQRPPFHHREGRVLPLGQEETHRVRPPVLEGTVAPLPSRPQCLHQASVPFTLHQKHLIYGSCLYHMPDGPWVPRRHLEPSQASRLEGEKMEGHGDLCPLPPTLAP